MAQVILGIIATIIGGIILLNIEYKTFVPQAVNDATRAENRVRELKRQVEAEQEAEALQAKLNAKRLEQQNKAQEAALRLELERAQKEEAKRQRERQAEADKRERWEYINNWRQANHGCDPPYKRFCTYVQGQSVGCSCM